MIRKKNNNCKERSSINVEKWNTESIKRRSFWELLASYKFIKNIFLKKEQKEINLPANSSSILNFVPVSFWFLPNDFINLIIFAYFLFQFSKSSSLSQDGFSIFLYFNNKCWQRFNPEWTFIAYFTQSSFCFLLRFWFWKKKWPLFFFFFFKICFFFSKFCNKRRFFVMASSESDVLEYVKSLISISFFN